MFSAGPSPANTLFQGDPVIADALLTARVTSGLALIGGVLWALLPMAAASHLITAETDEMKHFPDPQAKHRRSSISIAHPAQKNVCVHLRSVPPLHSFYPSPGLPTMVNANLTAEHNLMTTVDGVEYIYNLGDIAWMIVATALVMIMIPGLGFFYAGLLRRKNALSMLWMSMCVFAVVSIEWFFWGFSLAFSEGANGFIGDLRHFGLMNVDIQPSVGGTAIPSLLYCIFQMMFACITPVIMCGAFADRARLGPVLIFVFCWSTIVYNPIACWTWNVGRGWSGVLGALDYAGVSLIPYRNKPPAEC